MCFPARVCGRRGASAAQLCAAHAAAQWRNDVAAPHSSSSRCALQARNGGAHGERKTRKRGSEAGSGQATPEQRSGRVPAPDQARRAVRMGQLTGVFETRPPRRERP